MIKILELKLIITIQDKNYKIKNFNTYFKYK